MTIMELCSDMPGYLRTRIVNALHQEGVDTVEQLDAYLDKPKFSFAYKLSQFNRLSALVPDIGHRCAEVLRLALEERAPDMVWKD
jgi:hypothetical protein